ncbi:hypothetical protein RD792_017278 [Penstemon davidsonii]|uniref:NB-ARC domain-containing protein n=1 Tax=Penstemon davidsonii TaxID=160366 RepID=A0ABR0CNY9_9LAMI|nr:hypothetical protein RD792_017278 [Penstemon davidsonii]
MDKLTGQQPTLQIIPITGMGGIGKTTLARNVYGNSLIVQRFDIRGWITVSQFYNIEQMLLGLLRGVGVTIDQMEHENSEYHHLGKILYQHLSGRMYLIIVDDLWNTDAWDKLKVFLPDTQGSRIMVTMRLKDVANYVGSSNLHEINLLDENKS